MNEANTQISPIQNTNEKQSSRFFAIVLLTAAASLPVFCVWVWTRPQPVMPHALPPLVLDAQEVNDQLARDDARASRAPNTELSQEHQTLFRRTNITSFEQNETATRVFAHQRRLIQSLSDASNNDEEVILALQARDLEGLLPALRGNTSTHDRIAIVGDLMSSLERYGLVEDGRQMAPTFVVRTLYKARWNSLHGRSLQAGFSRIERQAYFGWLALHGGEATANLRLSALDEFRELGGANADEAIAIYLCLGEAAEREPFNRARSKHPTARLRNMEIACLRQDANLTRTQTQGR